MTDLGTTAQPHGEPGIADVTVVVVTYNAPEWTERCLTALLDTARPTATIDVVVVDNASGQQTRDVLAAFADRVQLVALDSNVGFGNACNLGAGRSRGRHVMLLNPDAVVHPGAVDTLVSFLAEQPQRGIVGGRTLRPDGRVDPSSCWGAPSLWSLFCFATGLSTVAKRNPLLDPESLGGWARDTVRSVPIVTGCLLLCSRSLWDELGGFDPDYFMYGEDADLCLRAAELGYSPAVTPDAVAVHAVGASSSTRTAKQVLLFRGKSTLLRKRWRGRRRSAGLGLLQAGVGARAAGELATRRKGTWRELWALRRDWVDGWEPASVAAATPGAPTRATAQRYLK